MKNLIILFACLLLLPAMVWSEESRDDNRYALGGGISLPDFSRSGLGYGVYGLIPVFSYLHIIPEIGVSNWELITAGSEDLNPDGSDMQTWDGTQKFDSFQGLLLFRVYPLTRWQDKLSPFLTIGGGYASFTFSDDYALSGRYNDQYEWSKKASTSNDGGLGILATSVGVDMPLDKIWALKYEYRFNYYVGTIGEENYISQDGSGRAGAIGQKKLVNYNLQSPINISIEIRPW